MVRTTLHLILGVLLWVVFGYYWYIVFQRPITPHTRMALIAVSTIVAVLTLFQVGWMIHNKRLARKRRRRKQRVRDVPSPGRDFLGRTVVAQNEEELRRAPYIEVHLVEMSEGTDEPAGHKIFRVSDRRPS